MTGRVGGVTQLGDAPDPRTFLVRAEHVLTCGPNGHVRDGAVAVSDGRIVSVGPYEELRRSQPGLRTVGDGTGILTPGFVSCHGHFSEGLVSGIGETHPLGVVRPRRWPDRAVPYS